MLSPRSQRDWLWIRVPDVIRVSLQTYDRIVACFEIWTILQSYKPSPYDICFTVCCACLFFYTYVRNEDGFLHICRVWRKRNMCLYIIYYMQCYKRTRNSSNCNIYNCSVFNTNAIKLYLFSFEFTCEDNNDKSVKLVRAHHQSI